MDDVLIRSRLEREGRLMESWFPVDEEAERCLRQVGTAAGEALAPSDEHADAVHEASGRRLLLDVDLTVRTILTRTVRPTYLPSARSIPSAGPKGSS